MKTTTQGSFIPCRPSEGGEKKQVQDFLSGDSCSCPAWNQKSSVSYFNLTYNIQKVKRLKRPDL